MHSTSRDSRRSPSFALFAIAVAATFGVGVWGIATLSKARVVSTSFGVDVTASAHSYVLERPTDATGWMALADSMAPLSASAVSPITRQAVAIAAAVAPVDPQVLRARMLVALKSGDTVTGLRLAADIAAMFPTESRDAFSILRAYMTDTEWPAFFQERLGSGWPAAESFLLDSCQSGAPLATLLAIAQPVIRRQALSENTINCIGTKAIAEGQVQAAYWVWLNGSATVPSPLPNVFNGDFERPLAARLFDWHVNPGGDYREGFAAAIRSDDSRGSRNTVLTIRFNGRAIKASAAQQFLVLAPGRYTLSYNVREIALSAPGSIIWTLRCVPSTLSPVMAAAQKHPVAAGWFNYSQTLVIPAGCDGQLLDLELGNRLQLAQGLQGSVLFDDVNVVRQ